MSYWGEGRAEERRESFPLEQSQVHQSSETTTLSYLFFLAEICPRPLSPHKNVYTDALCVCVLFTHSCVCDGRARFWSAHVRVLHPAEAQRGAAGRDLQWPLQHRIPPFPAGRVHHGEKESGGSSGAAALERERGERSVGRKERKKRERDKKTHNHHNLAPRYVTVRRNTRTVRYVTVYTALPRLPRTLTYYSVCFQ